MGGVGRFLSIHKMENISANLAKQVSTQHPVTNVKTNASESFKLPHQKLMSQSFASDIEAEKGDQIKLPNGKISDERRTTLQQWGRPKESEYPLPEDDGDVSTAYGNINNNADCDPDSEDEDAK